MASNVKTHYFCLQHAESLFNGAIMTSVSQHIYYLPN